MTARLGTTGPLSALLLLALPAASPAQQVKVSVVAILASETSAEVDSNLKRIAEEVRKREPSLTGFKLDRTTNKTIPLNTRETFPLPDHLSAAVEVQVAPPPDPKQPAKDYRVTLSPPTMGDITYDCKQGRYFPVVTRHQTKDKERLIIAVMVAKP